MLWFRRDLRCSDNPALLAAVKSSHASGDARVVPLYVIDPKLWESSGDARRSYLVSSLQNLDAALDGHLYVRFGDPTTVVPEVAHHIGAVSVHIAADYGPYGTRRDAHVEAALLSMAQPTPLVRTGSPYAVAPGRVSKEDGSPYRVYTPFYKAWLRHGWRPPAAEPDDVEWFTPADGDGYPEVAAISASLPQCGEAAALERWRTFRVEHLSTYSDNRNRPDLPATSRLSAALKWGEVHPRTLLADLDDSPGAEVFRRELAWREFYADVLHHAPSSAKEPLDSKWQRFPWNSGPTADAAFEAWASGKTGYPIVDAGMRQLLAEGWMHNRVRMIVASFLIKDLHLDWRRGAAWFMRHLIDGDLASNQQGWQWVAGSGTDAAPYYRIFNPVTQGRRFDPDGEYVRRYVPELRSIGNADVHEPWLLTTPPTSYPAPIVDHAVERLDALARYDVVKGAAE